jgi:HSP20 family protein
MSPLLTDVLDIDRFFDNESFFRGMRDMPSANIREKEKQFEVELAAPGMDKKDFRIEIDNNILSISAEREDEKTEEKDNYTRREFSYNSFARSFQIPSSVNAEAIKATYTDGILILTLPKKEEAASGNKKAIEIS